MSLYFTTDTLACFKTFAPAIRRTYESLTLAQFPLDAYIKLFTRLPQIPVAKPPNVRNPLKFCSPIGHYQTR